jgi:hypothetical protein
MTLKELAGTFLTPGLRRFSNIHKGETCYIFGNGPSIKWFDLSLFSDHPALCCGMIPFHRDFDKLDVRYVTIVEPWAFVPKLVQPKILHDFRTVLDELRRFIESRRDKEFFVNLSNRPWLWGKNIHYVFRGLPWRRNPTDELLGRFDVFGGSFHASLALAYYFGFSKIYLVGFDAWTIQPARNIRFYELGEGTVSPVADLATEFLGVIKRQADIYTISYDGTSENVESVSYESYTGHAPRYQENYELMDERYLRILASYPLHNIYPRRAEYAAVSSEG